MKNEAGKFYRMRDGRVVGPMMLRDENDRSKGFRVSEPHDNLLLMWDESGKFDGFISRRHNDEHDHLDLEEEVSGTAEAWGGIAAQFDVDIVRRWARAAAKIVDEMPVETDEDRRQIAAYNKLRRGLEHIIAEQDRSK